MNIEVSLQESGVRSPIEAVVWQQWFSLWLDDLQPWLPRATSYELSLRLMTDDEIQALNVKYRQQDAPTDVLAFAALEAAFPMLGLDGDPAPPLYLGDIAISVETAKRQALEQNHSLVIELAWLATHGLLHLLGWDHPDEESLNHMLNWQATLLREIGLTRE